MAPAFYLMARQYVPDFSKRSLNHRLITLAAATPIGL
jgi:hypothetical protein